MANGTYAPVVAQQFFTDAGAVLSGGLLNFYQAGTSTRLDTYSDVGLTTPNANPVVLDAAGRAGAIFFAANSYKAVLTTSAGVVIWTRDNILAVPTTNVDLDIDAVAGEAVSATNLLYEADGTGGTTAGRWYKTDADAAATSTTPPQIGFAVTDAALAATGTVRKLGRMTGFVGLTPGTNYYVSSTAGAITASPGLHKRFVGTADSATSLVIGPAPAPIVTNASRSIYNCGTTPGTGIAAGATAYLGSRGRSATESSADDQSPVAGSLKNLYVRFDGSPGAGQSFTVTVRKNGAATALTCTVSDAAIMGSDVANLVSVAAGDRICVQVVASAGASTRECAAAFEISY